MALMHSDFDLTDTQLDRINRYIDEAALRYAQAREETGWGAKVVFEWVPGLGRSVTVLFDGASDGIEVND